MIKKDYLADGTFDRASRKEENKNEEKLRSREKPKAKIFVIAMIIILLILSSVFALRLIQHKPLLPTGESYYNLRLAQELKVDPLLVKDPVQSTAYQPNPYHYLLVLMLLMFSPEIVSILTPLALGLISAIIFFKLLTLLGVKHEDAAFSLIILAVSPAFITLFSGLYIYSFVLFLSLLIIFLVIIGKKSKYTLALSSLLLLILALASLTGFLITIALLIVICSALKRKIATAIMPVIPSFIALIFLVIFSIYPINLLGFHGFEFKNILSALGADIGFDIFLIILFFAGFIILWNKNEEKRFLHLVVLAFIIFSFFNTPARAFSSFIITNYCVVAITYFYKRKWELDIIRTGTLLLVLCSLIFSLINQVNVLVQAQPDQEMQEALIFLKKLDSGIVLSAENSGFIVEFYSGKQALLDKNSFLNPDYRNVKTEVDHLFMMPRLKEAEPLLQKYKIRYVFITPWMKEELWEGREEGFLLLVKNSESFIRKYDYEGVEIWEYRRNRRV
jgi:hypothetical protein